MEKLIYLATGELPVAYGMMTGKGHHIVLPRRVRGHVFVCQRSCVCVLEVMCLCVSGHVFVCQRSCVCVLEVMCLCVSGITVAYFYDFYISYWNCSESVIFFIFHFITSLKYNMCDRKVGHIFPSNIIFEVHLLMNVFAHNQE